MDTTLDLESLNASLTADLSKALQGSQELRDALEIAAAKIAKLIADIEALEANNNGLRSENDMLIAKVAELEA